VTQATTFLGVKKAWWKAACDGKNGFVIIQGDLKNTFVPPHASERGAIYIKACGGWPWYCTTQNVSTWLSSKQNHNAFFYFLYTLLLQAVTTSKYTTTLQAVVLLSLVEGGGLCSNCEAFNEGGWDATSDL